MPGALVQLHWRDGRPLELLTRPRVRQYCRPTIERYQIGESDLSAWMDRTFRDRSPLH